MILINCNKTAETLTVAMLPIYSISNAQNGFENMVYSLMFSVQKYWNIDRIQTDWSISNAFYLKLKIMTNEPKVNWVFVSKPLFKLETNWFVKETIKTKEPIKYLFIIFYFGVLCHFNSIIFLLILCESGCCLMSVKNKQF